MLSPVAVPTVMNPADIRKRVIACHGCDLLHREIPVSQGRTARCPRCSTPLYRERADSVDRTLALTIAAAVLFIASIALPLLEFRMHGRVSQITLTTGISDLYGQGYASMATLVLVTGVLGPAVHIAMLLYLLVPIRMGRRPWGLASMYRMTRHGTCQRK